jgi:hypothetical protein
MSPPCRALRRPAMRASRVRDVIEEGAADMELPAAESDLDFVLIHMARRRIESPRQAHKLTLARSTSSAGLALKSPCGYVTRASGFHYPGKFAVQLAGWWNTHTQRPGAEGNNREACIRGKP